MVTYPAPGTEQIKFFMVADRLMQKQRIYRLRKLLPELEEYLPTGLAEAEKVPMRLA